MNAGGGSMARIPSTVIRAAAVAFAVWLLPAAAQPQVSQQSQDVKEFSVWMESANQLNGKLGYFLKEKDGAESAKAAQEMQQTFTHVLSFFEAKKADAPAKYAKAAVEGFKKTEDLAAAGKLPEALQAYYDARENCEGCHKDHRVRGADGEWQIQY
jgi:hypothetical protein